MLAAALIGAFFLLVGAGGCSSDPNVEGAKLDLRNKDYDRALSNLNLALEQNPDNFEALKLKGTVLMEKAGTATDPEERSELVSQAAGNWQRALSLAASNSERNDVATQMQLAWFREYERGMSAFNRSGEDQSYFEEAVRAFRNATLILPDSAVTHINLAYALISAGRPLEAIGPLETAIEKGDNNPDTYNYLTELYLSDGQTERAITFGEGALERFPEDENLRARLFNAYIQAGQVDRGIALARQGVEENPDNATYRYNYGSLLLQAERYDEAIAELTRATELDPESSNAFYNLGAAYENWAVGVNVQIADLEDAMRAPDVTDERREELQKEVDVLAEQRHGLFESAIPPLVKARELVESRGEDPTDICNALFQAYAQHNDMEKAQEAATCAGIDLGN